MKEFQQKHIVRLMRMMYLLQSQRYITKEKIIDELKISERTLFRYFTELKHAGLEIKFSNSSYTVDEGNTALLINRIKFTEDESIAFVIADKLIENYSDDSVIAQYRHALLKIKTALIYADKKDFVEYIEKKTTSRKRISYNQNRFPNNFLIDVQKAIASNKTLKINYFTYHKNELTLREIAPISVNMHRLWHIRAFCLLRNKYRDFRLDRIEKLEITNNTYDKTKYNLDDFLKSRQEGLNETNVIVQFDKSIERLVHIGKQNFTIKKESETDINFEITFGIDKFKKDEFLRWLLTWGKNCTVVKPLAIRKEIKKLVNELVEHWK